MRFRKLMILAMVAGLALASGTYAKRGPEGGGPPGHAGGNGEGKGNKGGGKASCESARCELAAEVDASCPCVGFPNHGKYVRCVVRTLKALAADGRLPRRCKGRVVRCAARSRCGKVGPLPCLAPVGLCDLTLGTCVADPTLPCAIDRDCGVTCEVADTAEDCAAVGGSAGGAITCCGPCGSPSGAFVQ